MLVQEGIYDDFLAALHRGRARAQGGRRLHGRRERRAAHRRARGREGRAPRRRRGRARGRGASSAASGSRASSSSRPCSSDVTAEMAMSCEETFGPVAGIARFSTEDEAVRIANDTPYGLAAYFYSQGLGRVHRVAEALEYGIVGINTGLISTEVAPFGGVKESGMGREGSSYGIDEWLELKYWAIGGIGDPSDDRRAARLPRAHGEAPRGAAAVRGARASRSSRRSSAGSSARSRPRSARSRRTRHIWRYDSFAEREERRARLAGRPALEGVPREGAAAHPHAAEPDPRPDLVLAAALMGALDGKVAIVTGGAQGIGAAIAAGLAGRGRDGRRSPTSNPPEGGIRADVSSEDDVAADGRGDARAPRPHRRPRQQRGALRLARDARVHRDPARGVEPRDGGERRLDVPHVPRGRSGDARAGRREDREHLVGHAVSRRPVPPALRDVEGRDRRAHARAREGARQATRST